MSLAIHRERPTAGRVTLTVAYILASAGLLLLALDHVLYDRVAIVGASAATIALLVLIMLTGWAPAWLGVGGAWVYAAVITMIRVPDKYGAAGLSLVFLALAFGALAAYTANRNQAELRL